MAMVPDGVAEPTTSPAPSNGPVQLDAHLKIDLIVQVDGDMSTGSRGTPRAEGVPHGSTGVRNDLGEFVERRATAHDRKRMTAELFEAHDVVHANTSRRPRTKPSGPGPPSPAFTASETIPAGRVRRHAGFGGMAWLGTRLRARTVQVADDGEGHRGEPGGETEPHQAGEQTGRG